MRKAARTAITGALLLGGAAGGYVAWRRYGGVDPYKAFVASRKPDPTTEIVAKGVRLRQYEKGKLVGGAEAKILTAGQNRNLLKLKGIKNGFVKGPTGTLQFAAGEGVLHPNTRSADLSGLVRVKGTDFDVQTSSAALDGRLSEMRALSPLKGTIGGGAFSAQSMVHRANTDYTRITRPIWIGKLPKAAQVPSVSKDKTWHFTGEDVVIRGTVETATDAYASDETMVITAPKVTQDTKTKVVTATGDATARATYHSSKADIVADKVVIYRDEKRAVCTGRVLVYVRPKSEWDKPLKVDESERGPLVPDIPAATLAKMGQGGALSKQEKAKIDELRSTKNLRAYPMQMAAAEVTYWYKEGERRAVAKGGNPTAYQSFDDGRWRQAWAPEARYDGEKDILDLVGGKSKREVHLQNSIEDVTDCFLAKMSTKEDQTEEDQYLSMKSPQGRGIDFDADKPKKDAPAKPPVEAANAG